MLVLLGSSRFLLLSVKKSTACCYFLGFSRLLLLNAEKSTGLFFEFARFLIVSVDRVLVFFEFARFLFVSVKKEHRMLVFLNSAIFLLLNVRKCIGCWYFLSLPDFCF